MAEKPPDEAYISVVDEEPEILELLKWDTPAIQKQHDQTPVVKEKTAEKRSLKALEMDPFDLPDPTFIETYRLSKDLVRSLCEELKPIMPDSTKTAEFSVESRVLATLAFYATGKYLKSICGKTDPNITHYFVPAALIQVTEAMNHPTIVKKHIHFPHLRQERDVVKHRFYMKYAVPNVVGCIECMHVPIAKPDEDQKGHFNKSYHSKKVQIICDSDLMILSVDPSPGSSTHDGILERHAVKVDLVSLNQTEQCWLIGGPYYSLKPYLMTPIPKIPKKSPVSPEKYYNSMHSQVHSAATDTLKHLKTRWKCLQATCNKQFDPATVSMMIVACCILHNMCNRRGLTITPMTQTEERLEVMKQKVANGPISKKLNTDENGLRVRAELVQRLWNERSLVPENSGPKKRMSKKDRLLDRQPNHTPNISQEQVSIQLSSSSTQQSHLAPPDDASKRPRIVMNQAPTYSLMQPVWGHYPQHH
ncbi:putative nuclease HARBI1 [Pectinophora gossypiella]|nr:putative nuclease HARBI1 [Pectinophora gossypiella]